MEQRPRHSVHLTRHSKAEYGPYTKIAKGDTPEQPMNYEDQPDQDLSNEGIALAREKANELFDTLDPKEDLLFFAASPERRTLDTAVIYRDVARERGFEIARPENVRGTLATQVGEGDIRVVEALSTKIDNTLIGTLFNPGNAGEGVRWENVSPETKQVWDAARSIIEADDRGTWGENFMAHSEKVKEVVPYAADMIRSAKDVYERDFRNLVRLATFGIKKAESMGHDKNARILSFGHETYLGYALREHFGNHKVGNCETLGITLRGDGTPVLEWRGNQLALENV